MIRNKVATALLFFALAATGAKAQAFKKRAKTRYRVDVLVPLYLDELVKGNAATYKEKVPQKAEYGVGFYAGVTLAADSLKNEGFNIDIYVHDAASAKEPLAKLVARSLDSSDLIIGSVSPEEGALIAALAKKNSVNFISTSEAPLANTFANPYLTFLQPSLKAHCDLIVDDVLAKFPKENAVVVYRTKNVADAAAYDYITDGLAHKKKIQYLAANIFPKKSNLGLFFDASQPCVIIVPVQDTAFADSLLHELSRDFPGIHFDVYGMPSWAGIAGIRKEGTFPTLSVNVPTVHTLDPSSAMGLYVKRIYKQVYTGKMPASAYYGYETMFWYANMLRKYGIGFNEKYTDSTRTTTHFDIQPQLDKSGQVLYYENKHSSIQTITK